MSKHLIYEAEDTVTFNHKQLNLYGLGAEVFSGTCTVASVSPSTYSSHRLRVDGNEFNQWELLPYD